MESAFQYVIDNGLTNSNAYPYKARDQTCAYQGGGEVTISGFNSVATKSDAALQAAITSGPVAVAIHAGAFGFQFYSSGIITSNCVADTVPQLDHGVTAIGFGT